MAGIGEKAGLRVMKRWIMLYYAELRDQRPPGETEDIHFTESLASAIITEFSSPGDLVLDPFAGFGTTPYIASWLDRRAVAAAEANDAIDNGLARRSPDHLDRRSL